MGILLLNVYIWYVKNVVGFCGWLWGMFVLIGVWCDYWLKDFEDFLMVELVCGCFCIV